MFLKNAPLIVFLITFIVLFYAPMSLGMGSWLDKL